ncbi:hypothetical protein JQ621_01610 [Bradyrhizobium manausense]|uniref:hypothetical protein n=1 Tax=Bradyrhizobium manausense TaxID=989370 RepID=UPI001BA66389|nr:hypothetical protein [Bradyrhizobium manausense]MBR1086166.1 hypothetical protein [Bradyrhizobium manausense]
MKKLYLVALFIVVVSPCMAQTVAGKALPTADLSVREQIKADRERDRKAEASTSSQSRPWDKDADGKRPWDRKDEQPVR